MNNALLAHAFLRSMKWETRNQLGVDLPRVATPDTIDSRGEGLETDHVRTLLQLRQSGNTPCCKCSHLQVTIALIFVLKERQRRPAADGNWDKIHHICLHLIILSYSICLNKRESSNKEATRIKIEELAG